MSAHNTRTLGEGLSSPTPTWKPVPGYEGTYEVSDQGHVRSLPRPTTRGRILRASVGKVGYPKVSLSSGGRQETRFVHQIVAAAFLGPRPDGHDVRHLDGNPLNSALSNLSYGTRSENELDKARHGTNPNARKTHCPQGHPYDEANTYRLGRHRTCRTCANASARRRYRQRKESTSSVAPGWTPTTSKEKAS